MAGIALAVVLPLTASVVERKESPLRIAFYYSLIGCILSGIVLFFLEVKAPVLTLPSLHLVTVMIITAILFSIVLLCFLVAFYHNGLYLSAGIISFYPIFIVAANWIVLHQTLIK